MVWGGSGEGKVSELWCDAPPVQGTHQGDISQHSASFSCFYWCCFILPTWKKGKANSPTCRTFGFMASTCPAPGRRWGSQGHLPSHWHAQGTVSMLIIPSILRKPLSHISALCCRYTMNRGSHLGFPLDVSFHGLLTRLNPALGEFTRVGDAFAPLPLSATN